MSDSAFRRLSRFIPLGTISTRTGVGQWRHEDDAQVHILAVQEDVHGYMTRHACSAFISYTWPEEESLLD